MVKHSGDLVNLTIRVDSSVLLLAKHRALLERTSVNRHLPDALEDYADEVIDVARRTMSAAHVFGVIEESRRQRRLSKKARQPMDMTWRMAVAPVAFRLEEAAGDAEEPPRDPDPDAYPVRGELVGWSSLPVEMTHA